MPLSLRRVRPPKDHDTHRAGILSAASDALGFRKKSIPVQRRKPATSSNVVPSVIEINAYSNTPSTSSSHCRDCELEERERLRDVAAQSIGLDPELLHSKPESPQSPTTPSIPPFPATLLTLRPFTELSATLPKFTPPSSLLVYALARQWKLRTIVLTSHPPTQQTHVHLFRANSKDEREIERLQVTEDSLVYVAEEDVGGRRNVVKFVGKNISSTQSTPITGETSHSMWFLHIRDPAESHRWIAAIKNAVLAQRAARAGLDIPAQLDGGNEPKGDMDVMLSMHLQRTMSAGPIRSLPTPPSRLITSSPSPPPSLHSLRINTSSSSSPTTTAKGIFSGTRSRSPSVDSSPTYPPGHAEDSFSAVGTSLLTMLRDKPSTDSGFSPSHTLSLPFPPVPRQDSPAPSMRSTSTPVIITASDLKISKERDQPEVPISIPETSSSNTPSGSDSPPTPFLTPRGTLTVSLQPPPRKSKHAVAPTSVPTSYEPQGLYSQTGSNASVAGDFGIPYGDPGDFTPRATSPLFPEASNGQPGPLASDSYPSVSSSVIDAHERERSDEVAQNLLEHSNASRSSFGSGAVPADRLPQSAVVAKRWSRQGVPLPKQPTPPSGPPPSIPPPSDKNSHRVSMESGRSAPGIDRSPSSSSSNFHCRAPLSARSGSSLSPTFWKRASSSSTYSASSISTSDSLGRSQLRFASESIASSSGSGVGNGTSLRPMSLSVHGSSSPVLHIGTTKRRSMPPPRPAPNFAPPPAPTIQESASEPSPSTTPTPVPQKSFRSSVAQRAFQLSLTSPKPPPSSALPPRPDEDLPLQGHHRDSSTETSDTFPTPPSFSRSASPLFRNATPVQRTSSPSKSLSIRQRLRILSTPPVQAHTSPTLVPPHQMSTLDLSDDNSDDPPTPYYYPQAQPIGLGEHILKDEDDPSFLQLGTPSTPTVPKPQYLNSAGSICSKHDSVHHDQDIGRESPRSPFRPISPPAGVLRTSDWRTPALEPGCDFIALSPPPPRRGSKPHVVPGTRSEKMDLARFDPAARGESSKVVALSQDGSVVSLGFLTT